MLDKDQLIENIIAHAAVQKYDPIKAKEYYERTKILKGRPKASRVQEKSTPVRPRVITAAQANAATLKLQKKAQQSLANIDKKLIELVTTLNQGLSKMPLNKISTQASPAQKTYLEKQNATIFAKNKAIASETFSQAKETARQQRVEIASSLKRAVSSIKADYLTALKQKASTAKR